jgi:S-adenosylmethionine decarboxylase proenzyme
MTDHPPRGTHALIDGKGEGILLEQLLNDGGDLQDMLVAALERAGATILKVVTQSFEPQGKTVVAVLAESHASVHTYPEHGVYMIDVFTCGDLDAERAAIELAVAIGGDAAVFDMLVINRGEEKPRGSAANLVEMRTSSN